MKSSTCCFTGHRKLPTHQIDHIVRQLNSEVDQLIASGVRDFVSGGALGFDQLAASLIVAKKELGKNIRLIFALPCIDQDALWSLRERQLYRSLLGSADEVIYVSEKYDSGCMARRNEFMVDQAAFCICALLDKKSGTGQTVRYAQEKGLRIINVAL